jgi:hypothetical protein
MPPSIVALLLLSLCMDSCIAEINSILIEFQGNMTQLFTITFVQPHFCVIKLNVFIQERKQIMIQDTQQKRKRKRIIKSYAEITHKIIH